VSTLGGSRPLGGLPFDETAAVYVISVAAELSGLHPQTLRQYDRLGLVSPGRSSGRGRRYSAHDIARLREVAHLSQEEGINLAGIKRILDLEDHVAALRQRVAELQDELRAAQAAADQREADAHASYRRDLVPLRDTQALVVWRPLGRPRPGR
jgi:MerR family transcriptional regulator/heat shock protein HspR